jgi:hypothetical protein
VDAPEQIDRDLRSRDLVVGARRAEPIEDLGRGCLAEAFLADA